MHGGGTKQANAIAVGKPPVRAVNSQHVCPRACTQSQWCLLLPHERRRNTRFAVMHNRQLAHLPHSRQLAHIAALMWIIGRHQKKRGQGRDPRESGACGRARTKGRPSELWMQRRQKTARQRRGLAMFRGRVRVSTSTWGLPACTTQTLMVRCAPWLLGPMLAPVFAD
jgi:hypothetical protein